MQLRFEHFAATSMLGDKDSPPRNNGKLYFDRWWERQAFGIAIALSKKGQYEWEDFRQSLITSIGEWEKTHDINDSSWNYYEQFLLALERVAVTSGALSSEEIEQRISDFSQSDACKVHEQL